MCLFTFRNEWKRRARMARMVLKCDRVSTLAQPMIDWHLITACFFFCRIFFIVLFIHNSSSLVRQDSICLLFVRSRPRVMFFLYIAQKVVPFCSMSIPYFWPLIPPLATGAFFRALFCARIWRGYSKDAAKRMNVFHTGQPQTKKKRKDIFNDSSFMVIHNYLRYFSCLFACPFFLFLPLSPSLSPWLPIHWLQLQGTNLVLHTQVHVTTIFCTAPWRLLNHLHIPESRRKVENVIY